MTAPATFALPALPLDGNPPIPPPTTEAAVEGETFTPCDQYRRLFGETRPDQVIVSVLPNPLPAGGTCGSPTGVLYPVESHPLFPLLADMGHPSAASLASIAALRARHLEKGHTPSADAAHGWVHFKRLSDEAYRAAVGARSAEARRKRLIIAIAILVAQLDAEDFLAAQQESTSHE